MEMRTDVHSYQTREDGFFPTYIANIRERIEATANIQVEDDNSLTSDEYDCLENSLHILYQCRSSLSIITTGQSTLIQGISNKQYTMEEKAARGDPIAQALVRSGISFVEVKKSVDELNQTVQSKLGELTNLIYKANDKEFVSLAIFMALLHKNLSKYDAFYGFGSVVADMLDLYEHTRNHQIKDMIKIELKKVPHEDRTFGPYDDKIKDFSKILKVILAPLKPRWS
jgi:hypothetical protein